LQKHQCMFPLNLKSEPPLSSLKISMVQTFASETHPNREDTQRVHYHCEAERNSCVRENRTTTSFITFRVSCRRRTRNTYWSHASVCLSACVSVRPSPHAHTTARAHPDVTWGNGRGYFLCTIGRICNRCRVLLLCQHSANAKWQRVLVLALCLVVLLVHPVWRSIIYYSVNCELQTTETTTEAVERMFLARLWLTVGGV